MPRALPRPRKRFGQHFLVQPDIARRIVSLAELGGDGAVLEIGPGRGALTAALAEKSTTLWLVEVDRDLAAALRARYAGRPQIHVIEQDILRVDLEALLGASAPVTVVANLPYNISTPVLMKLLERPHLFSRLILMLQREVAERLAAPSGSRTYGALSILAQVVADVRLVLHVAPTAFRPVPKVESTVVCVTPHRPPRLSDAARAALRRVVRGTFAQRRKQLQNTLAPLCKDPESVLRSLDIDPRRRPETLTVEDFVRLTRTIFPQEE